MGSGALSVRELALAGTIAIAFGLGSYYATDEFGRFGGLNLAIGSVALLIALIGRVRRFRGLGSSVSRRALAPQILLLVLVCAGSILAERLADRAGIQFDASTDQRFDPAPATREALARIEGEVRVTLFFEPFDPRARRTRLMLDTLARLGPLQIEELAVDQAEAELDRFGVSSANSVVLERGAQFEVVERPTEGSLLEGLLRLENRVSQTLYVALGEGEGDMTDGGDLGFAGLASALSTEGYEIRGLVTSAIREIPADAAGIVIVAPRRRLRAEALTALATYLDTGGRLIALLEPGYETGLEPLLERYGFGLPPAAVVDPASGPVEGLPDHTSPLVSSYAQHPATAGLSQRTMALLPGARPVFALRKPRPEDHLSGLAFSSHLSWLWDRDRPIDGHAKPARAPGTPVRPHSMSAAGRYPRPQGETRIVVFGDSDFARNAYLRSLYNLDLIVNAVHWVTASEERITLRPKVFTPTQEPLPPEYALRMLYGVGLLVPEILLICGAIVWLRKRSA